jgi:hypothetical protein
MNFREYYRLNEDRTYILMKDRNGQYQVIGPKTQAELPQAMRAAKEANKPQRMWTYSIQGGKLNLPPELAGDKESILQAHYTRMGFNQPALPEPTYDDESEFIDPSVFNPEYGKSGWKQYAPQPGTIDYAPISGATMPPKLRT